MKFDLFEHFKLHRDRENYRNVINDLEKEVEFKGANLWILIFAIFVASLGLNVNSTAVIIGAMLISPLMGPIMGLGLSLGINDLALFRKSVFNYLFAAAAGLATSTLYFLITPINTAHSEILARTSPNIYDVLIAFFGGLAGIIATSTKYKGNVIPGVAIATALMPPLCTAGYGLATLTYRYFFGAFYLFLINTVFIALATLLIVRLMNFPAKKLPDQEAEVRAKRITWAVVLITLLPSVYFGYDIVVKERFLQNAERFIAREAQFPGDYLLNKNIDAPRRTIRLVYGGKKIQAEEIAALSAKLPYYRLENAVLDIKQGFENIAEVKLPEQPVSNPLKQVLLDKEQQLNTINGTLDSLRNAVAFERQLELEARAILPSVRRLILAPPADSAALPVVFIQLGAQPAKAAKNQLQSWLHTKLNKQVAVVWGQ